MSAPSSASSCASRRLRVCCEDPFGIAAVAERGRGIGGVAEWTVERGRVFDTVSHDRGALESGGIQAAANRADHAIHHARRRNDVRARLRLSDSGAREIFQRRIVLDFARGIQYTAMAVVRVFAKTIVSDQQQIGDSAVSRTQRFLNNAFFRPRF